VRGKGSAWRERWALAGRPLAACAFRTCAAAVALRLHGARVALYSPGSRPRRGLWSRPAGRPGSPRTARPQCRPPAQPGSCAAGRCRLSQRRRPGQGGPWGLRREWRRRRRCSGRAGRLPRSRAGGRAGAAIGGRRAAPAVAVTTAAAASRPIAGPATQAGTTGVRLGSSLVARPLVEASPRAASAFPPCLRPGACRLGPGEKMRGSCERGWSKSSG
jgi:hypothetical protein